MLLWLICLWSVPGKSAQNSARVRWDTLGLASIDLTIQTAFNLVPLLTSFFSVAVFFSNFFLAYSKARRSWLVVLHFCFGLRLGALSKSNSSAKAFCRFWKCSFVWLYPVNSCKCPSNSESCFETWATIPSIVAGGGMILQPRLISYILFLPITNQGCYKNKKDQGTHVGRFSTSIFPDLSLKMQPRNN